MNVSERGLKLIELFEGFSPTQYDDGTGTMTIGYGTTAADISPLPRYLTRQQAEDLLREKLARKYVPSIAALHIPLNQNQIDALASFVYNLGTGFLEPGYTMGRLLRARAYRAAADAMLQYDHVGGQVWQGLKVRRENERALFLRPMPRVDPLAVLLPHERKVVRAYDRYMKHPRWYPGRIAQARREMVQLRKAIWLAANRGRNPGWNKLNRAQRYHILLQRTT